MLQLSGKKLAVICENILSLDNRITKPIKLHIEKYGEKTSRKQPTNVNTFNRWHLGSASFLF